MSQNHDYKRNTQTPIYPGRLAIQQRVLPSYRVDFFDTLALSCQGGLSVFAGLPRADESIQAAQGLEKAIYSPARNFHLGRVSSPYYVCWQRGLISWLQEWQPDALIMEANPRYRSSRRASVWMHRRRRPVIGWGLGSPRSISRGDGLLERLQDSSRQSFYHMFDGMIAYSQQGAEEFRTLGFPQECIFVAPNAVVHRPLDPYPFRPDTFIIPPSILFVGRLQARKRVDLLIKACSELPEALQPDLVIVGDGPDRERLQQLAKDVYSKTEFPGAIHGANLMPLFSRADLFVLPGTGGLAVQQAMGYALPVIVAEGDGTQDDLVRPDNGWRVQPGDLASLKAALAEALSHPERLRRMGNESYRIVQEEANIETMVSRFVEALHSIRSSNVDYLKR